MNVVQIMVTIIIVTILVTIVLGVGSYVAYRLRQARRPVRPMEESSTPRFFYRYEVPAEDRTELADAAGSDRRSGDNGARRPEVERAGR